MDRAAVKLEKEKAKARNVINTYKNQIEMSQTKAKNEVTAINNRIGALQTKADAITARSVRIVNGYNAQIRDLELFINGVNF